MGATEVYRVATAKNGVTFMRMKSKANIRNLCHRCLSLLVSNILPFFAQRHVLRFFRSKVGAGVTIHRHVFFYYGLGNLEIGDNTTINSGVRLDNRGKIRIGANVSISRDCLLLTAGHDIQSGDFAFQRHTIEIGDRAVLFTSVIVCPKVSIGDGAVILPGSVVVKNVPEYEVWGGNPAKFIKKRSNELIYELKHDSWFAL